MTYVQSNYGAANPSASQGVTLTTDVAVGDLIVVSWRTGNAITGLSDNLGNSYTAQNDDGLANTFGTHYSVVTTGGSCTVTVTQSSGRIGVAVHHYSGNDAAPADNDTIVNAGTATSSASPSFTTSVADGVVVSPWGGSTTPTPDADYGGATLQGNGTGRLYTAHRLFTSTLTGDTADWTHANTGYTVKAVSFKSAAGGATTRGNPFNAGNAFNGGRTFAGILR